MITNFKDEELEELINGKRVLLFFTTDWCGYCKMLKIELESLMKENSDLRVVSIDIDKHSEIGASFGIMSIPVLIYYEDGIKKRVTSGYKPVELLREFIK